MRTDRQIDVIKLTVAFWNYFSKAPKCLPLPGNKPPHVSDRACILAPCWSQIAAELRRTYVRPAHRKREK